MPQPRKTAGNPSICYISLGGNATSLVGRPILTINAAFERLRAEFGGHFRTSGLYETPAFPSGSGPNFVNAVAGLETTLGPQEVLARLHEIESAFGRVRENRWAARTLDLDLLAHGSVVHPDLTAFQKWRDLPLEAQMTQAPETLILPHPRIADRAFVLVPWAEIAPDWVHPVSGLSVTELCEHLPEEDKQAVKRL